MNVHAGNGKFDRVELYDGLIRQFSERVELIMLTASPRRPRQS